MSAGSCEERESLPRMTRPSDPPGLRQQLIAAGVLHPRESGAPSSDESEWMRAQPCLRIDAIAIREARADVALELSGDRGWVRHPLSVTRRELP